MVSEVQKCIIKLGLKFRTKEDIKKFRCKICGHLWIDHYESIVKGIYVCGKDNCTDWNRCGKPPKEFLKLLSQKFK